MRSVLRWGCLDSRRFQDCRNAAQQPMARSADVGREESKPHHRDAAMALARVSVVA